MPVELYAKTVVGITIYKYRSHHGFTNHFVRCSKNDINIKLDLKQEYNKTTETETEFKLASNSKSN